MPNAIVDAIETGLTVTGGGSLRNAQAVKSDDFQNVWFISADIQGSGLEGSDDIGTWAMPGETLTVRGVYSVGGVANEFSDWGDGGTTDAELSISDDGVEESHECAEDLGD